LATVPGAGRGAAVIGPAGACAFALCAGNKVAAIIPAKVRLTKILGFKGSSASLLKNAEAQVCKRLEATFYRRDAFFSAG